MMISILSVTNKNKKKLSGAVGGFSGKNSSFALSPYYDRARGY